MPHCFVVLFCWHFASHFAILPQKTTHFYTLYHIFQLPKRQLVSAKRQARLGLLGGALGSGSPQKRTKPAFYMVLAGNACEEVLASVSF